MTNIGIMLTSHSFGLSQGKSGGTTQESGKHSSSVGPGSSIVESILKKWITSGRVSVLELHISIEIEVPALCNDSA